jgi:hypothetical protein
MEGLMTKGTFIGLVLLCGVASANAPAALAVADYEAASSTLIGYQAGASTPSYLKHASATKHLEGTPPHLFPPNPCRAIADEWNYLARQAEPSSARFEQLMTEMGKNGCNAEVVVVDGVIVSISPRL